MKTPKSEDLDCAAEWVDACKGEDRFRLCAVAAWLRDKAEQARKRENAAFRRRHPAIPLSR